MKEQAYNKDRDQDHKSLTTKAISFDLMKECHNELTSGEIVSRKISNHGFVGYPFEYRVTLGFGSIAGGLDHVNPVIRLPLEHGISRVLGKDDYSNPSIGTNPVTASIT
ncbi:hypothetical protein Tco_0407185 [Tanacetum coccineum]